MALTELARFLPRGAQHNRYLRSGLRPHHREEAPEHYRRNENGAGADSEPASLGGAPLEPAVVPDSVQQVQSVPKDPMA